MTLPILFLILYVPFDEKVMLHPWRGKRLPGFFNQLWMCNTTSQHQCPITWPWFPWFLMTNLMWDCFIQKKTGGISKRVIYFILCIRPLWNMVHLTALEILLCAVKLWEHLCVYWNEKSPLKFSKLDLNLKMMDGA